MQLSDALCYVLFTITVIAANVQGVRHKGLAERRSDKRINKRDASILIDTLPYESSYEYDNNPKVVYKRISKHRYLPPKSKYSTPTRTKYGPSKPRKPITKFKKHSQIKHLPPRKYTTKSRYLHSNRQTHKPIYGTPKKYHRYTSFSQEPAGFGERPTDYMNEYKHQTATYGEPPVDSYGAPLKSSAINTFPTSEAYVENPRYAFNEHDHHSFDAEYPSLLSFQRDLDLDNVDAFSNKRPVFIPPDMIKNINQEPETDSLDSYTDVYKYNHNLKDVYVPQKKKRQHHTYSLREPGKVVVNSWKSLKMRPEGDDEILVGGQYAEPPARYVTKFQPSTPMFENDDEFAPPNRYTDSEVASSISPYVNYKNSNMAFSPQNLNDAFSIVEK